AECMDSYDAIIDAIRSGDIDALEICNKRGCSYLEDEFCGLSGHIETETKHRMCYQALYSRRCGMWCAGGGNPRAHAGLHQEERRSHGADADDKSGSNRWLMNPCCPPEEAQQTGEHDACQVMNCPPHDTFAAHWC